MLRMFLMLSLLATPVYAQTEDLAGLIKEIKENITPTSPDYAEVAVGGSVVRTATYQLYVSTTSPHPEAVSRIRVTVWPKGTIIIMTRFHTVNGNWSDECSMSDFNGDEVLDGAECLTDNKAEKRKYVTGDKIIGEEHRAGWESQFQHTLEALVAHMRKLKVQSVSDSPVSPVSEAVLSTRDADKDSENKKRQKKQLKVVKTFQMPLPERKLAAVKRKKKPKITVGKAFEIPLPEKNLKGSRKAPVPKPLVKGSPLDFDKVFGD